MAAGTGLPELIEETTRLLKAANIRDKVFLESPAMVFRPRAVDKAATVRREGNSFFLVDRALERLLDKLDMNDQQDVADFNKALEKMGINRLLKSAGAKTGATVVTGNTEWEWSDDEPRRRGRHQ